MAPFPSNKRPLLSDCDRAFPFRVQGARDYAHHGLPDEYDHGSSHSMPSDHGCAYAHVHGHDCVHGYAHVYERNHHVYGRVRVCGYGHARVHVYVRGHLS